MRGPVFDDARRPDGYARVTVDAETGTVVWPGGADSPHTLHGPVGAGRPARFPRPGRNPERSARVTVAWHRGRVRSVRLEYARPHLVWCLISRVRQARLDGA